jgi:hypothetical protein
MELVRVGLMPIRVAPITSNATPIAAKSKN